MKNSLPGRRKFIKITTFTTLGTYLLSCMKFTRNDKSKSDIPFGDTLHDLRCEFQPNPLGLDVLQPALSWKFNDQRRGAYQKAYHIQVASSQDALIQNKPNLCKFLNTASIIAGVLGFQDDKMEYQQLRQEFLRTTNEKFYDSLKKKSIVRKLLEFRV